MSKRFIRKYKLVNFYEEDLWGKLAIFNSFKKVKINKKLVEELQRKKFFTLSIQEEKRRLINKFSLNKRIPFKVRKRNQKLFEIYLKSFIEGLKVRNKFGFSFRTDIGTPKVSKRILTEYAVKLKFRHILRFFAGGSINVKQFRNYFKKARRYNSFLLSFFNLIESRLDTLIYRFNILNNSGQIRQAINHGFFLINGKLSTHPGQTLKIFDILTVKNKNFFYSNLKLKFRNNRLINSIPFFLEINFRIMALVLYTSPKIDKIFFPTKKSVLSLISSSSHFNKFHN